MARQSVSSGVGSQTPAEQLQSRFQELLDLAGIRINGYAECDITVHNDQLYNAVLTSGTLGFAESYMKGWWDCPRLDKMFTRLLAADLNRKLIGFSRIKFLVSSLWYALFNHQRESRAYQVGEAHYDIGNDLYRRMLDPTMTYSCAYWADASDLESAQKHKLDLICSKLELEPGMRLLDIGCGWGGLAAHAARYYGVEVTGVTVSREQQKLAQERCAGLPVDIRLMDYRSLEGRFDRIVSVGMFEHVGPKNYRTFFKAARRLLDPNGLFLLHTIGEEETTHSTDPFIHKYIFPNGKVASRKHLSDATIDLFRLEDWHNFGPDYDKTLMAWGERFERSWHEIRDNYSERFYRMWRFYLYCSAGFFRSRKGQLWQVVLAHPDRQAAYRSIR